MSDDCAGVVCGSVPCECGDVHEVRRKAEEAIGAAAVPKWARKPTQGEQLRDEAIEHLETTYAMWVGHVIEVIVRLDHGLEFTTDVLWPHFGYITEPRAMGAAMVRARKLGLIEATGHYKKSTRSECHARPCAIWRRR